METQIYVYSSQKKNCLDTNQSQSEHPHKQLNREMMPVRKDIIYVG